MELILVLSILGVTNIDRNAAWWETYRRWNLYKYNLWHKLKKDESSEVLGNTFVNNVWVFHCRQSPPYLLTYDIFISSSYQGMSPFPSFCPCEDSPPLWVLFFPLATSRPPLSSYATSHGVLERRTGDAEADAGKSRSSHAWNACDTSPGLSLDAFYDRE